MKKVIGLGLVVLLGSGCTEFFTQNISEVQITVNSPTDSLYTSQDEITFWWESDAAIEKYRFQVVSPDFDNPASIFDTLLLDNLLSLNVNEGRYFWRLRGENEGSESAYQLRNFVIDQTAPLPPVLLYPSIGTALNHKLDALELRWQSLDTPIQGISASVEDSLRLYQVHGGNPSLLQAYFLSSVGSNVLAIQEDLPAIPPDDTLHIQWQVISYDPAGNKTSSPMLSFSVY